MVILAEALSRSAAVPQLAVPAQAVAWTDVVMALGVALLALMGLAVGIGGLIALRTWIRFLHSVERAVERLSPHVEPLLGHATRVAEDASELTRAVRTSVEEMTGTLGEVNQRLRSAVHAAEDRVRQFGRVVDVVQEEVEDLLLDAAATARGVHVAAEALRRPRGPGLGMLDEEPDEPPALR